jgi:hypothetical protein
VAHPIACDGVAGPAPGEFRPRRWRRTNGLKAEWEPTTGSRPRTNLVNGFVWQKQTTVQAAEAGVSALTTAGYGLTSKGARDFRVVGFGAMMEGHRQMRAERTRSCRWLTWCGSRIEPTGGL